MWTDQLDSRRLRGELKVPWKLVAALFAMVIAIAVSNAGPGAILLINKSGGGPPPTGACPVTVGTLTLNVSQPRSAGISPFVAFFDATASTDSAATNSVAQDVYFYWTFGDSGASGSGTWAYGSNPGGNSMNTGTGISVAHAYRIPWGGGDTNFVTTVTATDGTNTATCNVGLTVYDPNGTNGFSGSLTTCVSSSGTPVAGSGGCPSGAQVANLSTIQNIFANSSYWGNGKRVLLKCGDTFTSSTNDTGNLTITKYALGAYGGCQDTTTNRPIISNNGGSYTYAFVFNGTGGNGTFSDLDCEGQGGNIQGGCFWYNTSSSSYNLIIYQTTFYNMYFNNEQVSIGWNYCSQCALVQVYMANATGQNTDIGMHLNGGAFSGAPWTGNTFNNITYLAVIGSHFDDGASFTSYSAETVRIYGSQNAFISNSDFLNAGPSYAVLKMHAGCISTSTWCGFYTQYNTVEDTYFAGNTGANGVEMSPQNGASNEHMRYIVWERNVFYKLTATSGRQLLISGQYSTVRDNAFYLDTDTDSGVQLCQRGTEPAPTNVEVYNNSFYAASGSYSGNAVVVASNCASGSTQPSNSFVQNNLGYFPSNMGGTISMVGNSGTGMTISNNTSSTLVNPAWTDASGAFSKITDWKPTANYSGGTSVPVYYDALGAGIPANGAVQWSPTWDLGAVHH
jgi:hypothetical protein